MFRRSGFGKAVAKAAGNWIRVLFWHGNQLMKFNLKFLFIVFTLTRLIAPQIRSSGFEDPLLET